MTSGYSIQSSACAMSYCQRKCVQCGVDTAVKIPLGGDVFFSTGRVDVGAQVTAQWYKAVTRSMRAARSCITAEAWHQRFVTDRANRHRGL